MNWFLILDLENAVKLPYLLQIKYCSVMFVVYSSVG